MNIDQLRDQVRILRFDKNKDGKLDRAEQIAEVKATDEKHAKHSKYLLTKYDLNKDGELDNKEIKAGTASFKNSLLFKYDLDHDGILSSNERKAAQRDFILSDQLPDFSLEPKKCCGR